MLSNPGLRSVQLLKGVLFLVLPFHVLLLIQHWVPPNIQKLLGPVAASNEERAQVESRAVLREHEVHRVDFPIAHRASRICVQILVRRRMGDVEGVEIINVTIYMAIEVVKQMVL